MESDIEGKPRLQRTGMPFVYGHGSRTSAFVLDGGEILVFQNLYGDKEAT